MDAEGQAEKREEETIEEVTKGHFPEAKKDTGRPRKDPLRPKTRMGSQRKEIRMANKLKKQH